MSRRIVKAFTLIELMVVVVIIGIVTSFAVPNYSKAVNRALAREMVNNLRVIAAAQESWRNLSGGNEYFGLSGGSSGPVAWKASLGANIISQKGVVYDCQVDLGDPANGCDCTAQYPGQWTYTITTNAGMTPKWSQITCSAGTCPAGVP